MRLGKSSVAVSLSAALTLALFFQPFLSSGGDLLSGNNVDNRLIIAILEHWRAWTRGEATLPDPNYFAPAKGVLGYSCTLALYAPPYLLGRAAGLDRYVALQFTLIALKLIGFLSFYLLLVKVLNQSTKIAIFASALFTLSNMYFVTQGHAQLADVTLLPALVLLGAYSWNHRNERLRSCAAAAGVGGLFGLMPLTDIHAPFFFALAAVFLLAVFAVLELHSDAHAAWERWTQVLKSFAPQLAAAALALAVSLIPFAMIYLPVLQQRGGRAFPDVETQMLGMIQIVNPGPANLVWGRAIQNFPALFQLQVLREIGRGWTPLVAIIFGIAATGHIRRGLKRDATSGQHFVAAVCVATLVLALIATRLGGLLPWRLIYEFFPAGKAVRVPGRVNLVLNLFVVAVAANYLYSCFRRAGTDVSRKISLACICAFMIFEQLNWDTFPGYSRREEIAAFQRVSQPPAECKSFYLAESPRPGREMRQIDAMLTARQFNIPTVNGYSGMEPAGWQCAEDATACEVSLVHWAADHDMAPGLCALNLTTGQWRHNPMQP